MPIAIDASTAAHSPFAMLVVDPESDALVQVNAAGLALLGYAQHAIALSRFSHFLGTELRCGSASPMRF